MTHEGTGDLGPQGNKRAPSATAARLPDRSNTGMASEEGDAGGKFGQTAGTTLEVVKGDDLKPFEHKMYWLTLAGIAVAVVTGAIFFSQFRVMTDQTQILASQSESAAASGAVAEFNTRKQLEIAQEQADAAQANVKVVQKTMRLEQRAWVAVETLDDAGFEPGKPYRVTITFKNTGRTPASEIESDVESEPVPKGEPVRFIYTEKPVKGGLISPNSVARRDLFATHGNPLDAFDFADFELGNRTEYVYGFLRYRDIFRDKHWLTFCFHVAFAHEHYYYVGCDEYNDAGDGDLPVAR